MSLRFKGADLRPVLTEAIANQCRIVLVKDQGVLPRRAWGASPDGRQQLLVYAVGCNPDTDPFDDWWHPAGRELGGDDFAEYFDPKDGLFTRSCTRRTISCCPPPPRTCPGRGASRLKRQPPRSPRSPRTGAFFCSHRGHRRACAFVSSRQGTPAGTARRHATGDDRMNTSSTSPRLHLLPVSLRTANVFVLAHHHRPVQAAKFALAVRWSTAT